MNALRHTKRCQMQFSRWSREVDHLVLLRQRASSIYSSAVVRSRIQQPPSISTRTILRFFTTESKKKNPSNPPKRKRKARRLSLDSKFQIKTTRDRIRSMVLDNNIPASSIWQFSSRNQDGASQLYDKAAARATWVRSQVFRYWNPDYEPGQYKPIPMDEWWWFWNLLFTLVPSVIVILVCELYGKPRMLQVNRDRIVYNHNKLVQEGWIDQHEADLLIEAALEEDRLQHSYVHHHTSPPALSLTQLVRQNSHTIYCPLLSLNDSFFYKMQHFWSDITHMYSVLQQQGQDEEDAHDDVSQEETQQGMASNSTSTIPINSAVTNTIQQSTSTTNDINTGESPPPSPQQSLANDQSLFQQKLLDRIDELEERLERQELQRRRRVEYEMKKNSTGGIRQRRENDLREDILSKLDEMPREKLLSTADTNANTTASQSIQTRGKESDPTNSAGDTLVATLKETMSQVVGSLETLIGTIGGGVPPETSDGQDQDTPIPETVKVVEQAPPPIVKKNDAGQSANSSGGIQADDAKEPKIMIHTTNSSSSKNSEQAASNAEENDLPEQPSGEKPGRPWWKLW